MEEGKGERYLASGRQYGNALPGVRHQEEECDYWYAWQWLSAIIQLLLLYNVLVSINEVHSTLGPVSIWMDDHQGGRPFIKAGEYTHTHHVMR